MFGERIKDITYSYIELRIALLSFRRFDSAAGIKECWRVLSAEQQCEKGIGKGDLTIDPCSNRLYIMDIPIHKVI
jgi:hypothetical protein